jgi:hypothetical protein
MQVTDSTLTRVVDGTPQVFDPDSGLWFTETLTQRIERLRPYIESTRYALTEDDVRHDYETGKHRYA